MLLQSFLDDWTHYYCFDKPIEVVWRILNSHSNCTKFSIVPLIILPQKTRNE